MSMIVAAFKYKLNPIFEEEFNRLYGYAEEHIAKIDGYEKHEIFKGENGHNMLMVYFRDKESFLQWDVHPEHKKYKQRGKEEIFLSYHVSVGEVFETHIKEEK